MSYFNCTISREEFEQLEGVEISIDDMNDLFDRSRIWNAPLDDKIVFKSNVFQKDEIKLYDALRYLVAVMLIKGKE